MPSKAKLKPVLPQLHSMGRMDEGKTQASVTSPVAASKCVSW